MAANNGESESPTQRQSLVQQNQQATPAIQFKTRWCTETTAAADSDLKEMIFTNYGTISLFNTKHVNTLIFEHAMKKETEVTQETNGMAAKNNLEQFINAGFKGSLDVFLDVFQQLRNTPQLVPFGPRNPYAFNAIPDDCTSWYKKNKGEEAIFHIAWFYFLSLLSIVYKPTTPATATPTSTATTTTTIASDLAHLPEADDDTMKQASIDMKCSIESTTVNRRLVNLYALRLELGDDDGLTYLLQEYLKIPIESSNKIEIVFERFVEWLSIKEKSTGTQEGASEVQEKTTQAHKSTKASIVPSLTCRWSSDNEPIAHYHRKSGTLAAMFTAPEDPSASDGTTIFEHSWEPTTMPRPTWADAQEELRVFLATLPRKDLNLDQLMGYYKTKIASIEREEPTEPTIDLIDGKDPEDWFKNNPNIRIDFRWFYLLALVYVHKKNPETFDNESIQWNDRTLETWFKAYTSHNNSIFFAMEATKGELYINKNKVENHLQKALKVLHGVLHDCLKKPPPVSYSGKFVSFVARINSYHERKLFMFQNTAKNLTEAKNAAKDAVKNAIDEGFTAVYRVEFSMGTYQQPFANETAAVANAFHAITRARDNLRLARTSCDEEETPSTEHLQSTIAKTKVALFDAKNAIRVRYHDFPFEGSALYNSMRDSSTVVMFHLILTLFAHIEQDLENSMKTVEEAEKNLINAEIALFEAEGFATAKKVIDSVEEAWIANFYNRPCVINRIVGDQVLTDGKPTNFKSPHSTEHALLTGADEGKEFGDYFRYIGNSLAQGNYISTNNQDPHVLETLRLKFPSFEKVQLNIPINFKRSLRRGIIEFYNPTNPKGRNSPSHAYKQIFMALAANPEVDKDMLEIMQQLFIRRITLWSEKKKVKNLIEIFARCCQDIDTRVVVYNLSRDGQTTEEIIVVNHFYFKAMKAMLQALKKRLEGLIEYYEPNVELTEEEVVKKTVEMIVKNAVQRAMAMHTKP